MTRNRALAKLWDAHDGLCDVAQFVEGHTLEDYLANKMLRSAVERKLEIAGEALSKLRELDPEIAGRVPDLPAIVGFRNILAHGYVNLDDERAWGVATGSAPKLRAALASLLDEFGEAQP